MFGAGHLCAVKTLNLFATLAKLFDHSVEVTAEVADLVIALGEVDGDVHVSVGHAGNLVLKLDHGTTNDDGEHHDHHCADSDRAGGGDDEYGITFRIAEREGDEDEEEESVNEDSSDRQYSLKLPVQTDTRHERS